MKATSEILVTLSGQEELLAFLPLVKFSRKFQNFSPKANIQPLGRSGQPSACSPLGSPVVRRVEHSGGEEVPVCPECGMC